MCTSGCGTLTASTFSRLSSVGRSGIGAVPQYIWPSLSTAMTMSFGLVSDVWLRSFGSFTGMVLVTTGMVIRKLISSTSMMYVSVTTLLEIGRASWREKVG